jgi:ferredoxin-fold anticodon binding domain-containing protein
VTPRTVILERGGKKTEFLIENVRLLNEKELNSWKSMNLKNVMRDISVFIPAASDAEIIKSVIVGREGIVSVQIIDTYKKNDAQSVTYRVTIYSDRDATIVQESIKALLNGIGCTIR